MKRMFPFAAEGRKGSWFWWGLNLGALLALLIWWWLRQKAINKEVEVLERVDRIVLPEDAAGEPAVAEELPTEGTKTEDAGTALEPLEETEESLDAAESEIEAAVDDLKVIEGIGPRSAQALIEAGVTTFAGLAGMDPDAIEAVLKEAGVRVPYPETWPEQAALAAVGKWDELQALQGSLKGGRRV